MGVVLSDDDRSWLLTQLAKRTVHQRLVLRLRIVLELGSGASLIATATKFGVNREMVTRWKKRFLEEGVDGLESDAPRSGHHPRSIPEDRVKAVLTITRLAKPDGATHWSTRTMATTAGGSRSSVQRIWNCNGLNPHLIRTLKLSTDPKFEEKLIDVVGLYLDPPETALVLCVDETSQTQALDRTPAGLPMKKGRCETMVHDYNRNGTTALLAALEV